MRSLSAVEEVFGFCFFGVGAGCNGLGRCVGVGVRDAGCFSEPAYADAVPDGDDECCGCGREDVAFDSKLVVVFRMVNTRRGCEKLTHILWGW